MMGLVILVTIALMYVEKIWPIVVAWFIFLALLCIWLATMGTGNGD